MNLNRTELIFKAFIVLAIVGAMAVFFGFIDLNVLNPALDHKEGSMNCSVYHDNVEAGFKKIIDAQASVECRSVCGGEDFYHSFSCSGRKLVCNCYTN